MSENIVLARTTNLARAVAQDPGVQHAAAGTLVAVGVAVVKGLLFPRV